MTRSWVRLAAILALLPLVACTTAYRNHGYVPRQDELATIAIGQDTKQDVTAKIGGPASDGLRRDANWYYVESRYRVVPFAGPQEIERQVLRIRFSSSGVVTAVDQFGLEDGQVVRLNANLTRTIDNDTGFIAQLLGAAGNGDASALLN